MRQTGFEARRALICAVVVFALQWSGAAPAAAQSSSFHTVSGASFAGEVFAPESIVSGFGTGLAGQSAGATTLPLPTELDGVSVTVTDSASVGRSAPLFFVSPQQINYVIPAGTAAGPATVIVARNGVQVGQGIVQIGPISPALFTAASTGTGVAAGFGLVIRSDGSRTNQFLADCGEQGCVPRAVPRSAGEGELYLELYGTGIRGRSGLQGVTATIAGRNAEVLFAGPQGHFAGLDQVNVKVPAELAAGQLVQLQLTVDGRRANAVSFLIGESGPVSGATVVMFDPSSPDRGPFPSNALAVEDSRQKTGLRVNLPATDCDNQPSACQDIEALNQVDGFHIQPLMRVRFTRPVRTPEIAENVRVVWLESAVAGGFSSKPVNTISRITQAIIDPATNTLYARPADVLDEQRRYLLVVTDGLRDASGADVEADPGFRQCLEGRATPYCAALSQAVSNAAPLFAGRSIVAASLFTTRSTTAWLESARQALSGIAPAVSRSGSTSYFDVLPLLAINLRQQTATSGPNRFTDFVVPFPGLLLGAARYVGFGSFNSPDFLDAQQRIAPRPSGQAVTLPAATRRVHFQAYLPASAKPANGFPVVIAGHGFGDNRLTSPTVFAPRFAEAGMATIAINAAGHGYGPESVIVLTTAGGNVEIPFGGRSVDLNGDGTIGAREGCLITEVPAVGLSDCLRQTVVDLAQLVRAIRAGIDLDGDGTADLDRDRIYYSGISLGAIYGTMLGAIEPEVKVLALNVGGGSVVDIARLSRSYRDEAALYLSQRTPNLLNAEADFNDNYVLRGQPVRVNDVPGAIEIQRQFDLTEWLQAGGDPLGFAARLGQRLSGAPGGSQPAVLWHYARGDQSVPNPTTSSLIRTAGGRGTVMEFRHDAARAVDSTLPENPHAYQADILGTGRAALITQAGQRMVAGFLSSQGTTIPDVNSNLRSIFGTDLFVQPVELPETLGY
jgi:uncharacterized protein (TIGR03437 family)